VGKVQRVAIARAIGNGPHIILADEPTAPLDSMRAHAVMILLERMARDKAAALLVVTHDESILHCFDRLISMRDGRIEGEESRARRAGGIGSRATGQRRTMKGSSP
jgi:putative ABC transport system ATP-binding protein